MSRLNSSAEVLQAMLDKLEGSALSQEDAKLLAFKPCINGAIPPAIEPKVPGFLIPYFNLAGKKTTFWRYRYLETTKEGFSALTTKKDRRYSQAPSTTNELYLPPFVDWAQIAEDPKLSIIITEGELKAACACKVGFPTIGLGGVWCWKSNTQKMPMLPQFDAFTWEKRSVIICFDSDAKSNPSIMAAENELARKLLQRGAYVSIARIESLAEPKKTGIDDYIVSEGAESFATHVLYKASAFDAAAALHELNEKVLYVCDPGLVLDLQPRMRMNPTAFVNHHYAPYKFVEFRTGAGGKTVAVEKSTAKEWLQWPFRAEVRRMTYRPGCERITEDSEYNMWRGWGCQPNAGTIKPWKDLLNFLFTDTDPANRAWFEKWLAYPLQHPGVKLSTSVLMWGRYQGTGKTIVGDTMSVIYGENAVDINEKDLIASFNEWAENKQFVMADEITSGDKRHSADRMKSMITQKQLRLNPKYIPSYSVPDCINYYFTSNHADAFFLEDTDRRFFINEVKGPPLSSEFYQVYDKWLKGSGPAALFHYLLQLDLTGFNPQGHAPMTQSKVEMIEDGRSDLDNWCADLVTRPDYVLKLGEQVLPYALWTTTELLGLYDPAGIRRVSVNGLGRALRKAGFERVYKGMGVLTSEGPQKLWAIRDPEKWHRLTTGPPLAKQYDLERGKASPEPRRKKF